MNKGVGIVASSKIKHLRELNNISQEVAADKISVSRPFYALIEAGEREPTLSQLYDLAELLNVTISDITTGLSTTNARINYAKFKEVILSCIRFGADDDGRITKTKLAKLVYFSDFVNYYQTHKSMTNATYRCIPRGPVADDYFRAIDELFEVQTINIEPKGSALMISANENITSKTLSSVEIQLIEKICSKWKDHSTEEIVEFSHNQNPWKNSTLGAFISYDMILEEPLSNLY